METDYEAVRSTRGSQEPCTQEPEAVESTGLERQIEQARNKLESSLVEVAQALAEHAGKGSFQHIKLFLQLLGLETAGLARKSSGPREKTLEEILTEQWQKEP